MKGNGGPDAWLIRLIALTYGGFHLDTFLLTQRSPKNVVKGTPSLTSSRTFLKKPCSSIFFSHRHKKFESATGKCRIKTSSQQSVTMSSYGQWDTDTVIWQLPEAPLRVADRSFQSFHPLCSSSSSPGLSALVSWGCDEKLCELSGFKQHQRIPP